MNNEDKLKHDELLSDGWDTINGCYFDTRCTLTGSIDNLTNGLTLEKAYALFKRGRNSDKVKIPSKFTLGAVDWTIEIDNEGLGNDDCLGTSCYVSNKIKVADNFKGVNLSSKNVELTTYHEVVHAILRTLGEHDLSSNEEFVNKFSVLLHQFENTKK